jgi:glyoxylase-like metal-dependent hydrolase (beta-lactamase superfamily II)
MSAWRFALAAALEVLGTTAAAQGPSEPEVTSEEIAPGFHVLFGAGAGLVAGNTAVSIGEQGTLVVDTQFPPLVPKYRALIRSLGGGGVDFAINTHWHDDHAEGNKVLGADGTRLIAHQNSRDMLTKYNKINVVRTVLDQPAYPAAALPVVTFDGRMHFYFNGERIDLVHVAPAHTAGDTAVIFRGRNAVHMGDVFIESGYPFVDVDDGGSLDGLIEFLRAVLDEIDRDTVVVPGHGALASYQDLVDYVAMLTAVRARIAELIAAGASREQVLAAEPTAEWDAKYGNPAVYFIDRAYASLTR